MKPTCRPPRARPGTTLIEVVLGLVVLSTLLVSVAIARGRFTRQWADADRRLKLVRAADELIATWLAAAPRPVPIGRGTIGTDTNATWQTRILPDRGAASLNAVVVRLDLYDARGGNAPAVSIDFLQREPSSATTRPASTPMRHHGFTLIELLVATVLAAVLMLAVLTVMAGVARDRNVLKTIDRPVSTAALDLLEADLRSAHTVARGPADDVVLSLVGNHGLDPATLRPNGRLVRVIYRVAGRALWREQEYLDDPVRPQVWADLVSCDPCDVHLDMALDELPVAVPPRMRLTVSTGGTSQAREVTR